MYGGFHERRMDMEPLVAEDAGRMKGYDVSGHEDARIDAHYSAARSGEPQATLCR